MTPARRQRGFSLLELTVASAVLLLGVWLATDLLTESARRLAAAGREMRQPVASLAERLLRFDLEAASAGPMVSGIWSGAPLVLVRPGGETIVYRVENEGLVRAAAAAGGEAAARTVLAPVVGWRWRRLSPALTEVEIAWEQEKFPAFRPASGRWRQRTLALESLHLVVASRGGGQGSGW